MLRFKKDDGTSYPEWEESQLEKYCYSISSGKTKTVESKGRYILYGSTGEIGRTNNEEFSGEYVLVARVGANAGTVNLRKGSFGVSDNTIVIKNKETISSSFLYYLLYKYNLKNLMFGSGQPLITSSQLKKLKLKIPHMEEQQKIADFLLEVDNIIASSEQEIESLEMQKKGAMQKIFSQEVRFKADDGSEYPEWENKLLPEIATLLNGRAYKSEEMLKSGKYPLLRVGNLFSNDKLLYSDLELEDDKYIKDGDLIYAWSATFGPRIFHGEKTIYHYHIWKVIPKEISTKYLYLLLLNDVKYIKKELNGGTMQHITKADMEKRLYMVPCLEEQQKIADFLSEFDNAIEYAKEELEVWKNIKKGLLQQMFE